MRTIHHLLNALPRISPPRYSRRTPLALVESVQQGRHRIRRMATAAWAAFPRLRPSTMVRGVSLFLGTFTLLNLAGELKADGFDANLWWIDMRALPSGISNALLGISGIAFTLWGLFQGWWPWLRLASTVLSGLLAGIAMINSIVFYGVWWQGRIAPGFPAPLSLFLALGLLALAVEAWREHRKATWSREDVMGTLAAVMACLVGFPLAQMLCFGKTDYRRHADAAVVFGARAYEDGTPSDALKDRVSTACALYRDGLVPRLIFSGGPGDGPVHEPEAMRRFANTLGVPSSAIVMDPHGLNTEATVGNTDPLLKDPAQDTVVAVSHFYHLPRIKMAYARHGRTVYTVPAKETYLLSQMPFLMVREIVALWAYYLRPLG